jgi:hypothetical protein
MAAGSWKAKLLKNISKIVVTEEGCFGWRGTMRLSRPKFFGPPADATAE